MSCGIYFTPFWPFYLQISPDFLHIFTLYVPDFHQNFRKGAHYHAIFWKRRSMKSILSFSKLLRIKSIIYKLLLRKESLFSWSSYRLPYAIRPIMFSWTAISLPPEQILKLRNDLYIIEDIAMMQHRITSTTQTLRLFLLTLLSSVELWLVVLLF